MVRSNRISNQLDTLRHIGMLGPAGDGGALPALPTLDGPASTEATSSRLTAFHLRKRGHELGGLDDEDLKQVPVLSPGTRLQQGATYINLTDPAPHEFTATGSMRAAAGVLCGALTPAGRLPVALPGLHPRGHAA